MNRWIPALLLGVAGAILSACAGGQTPDRAGTPAEVNIGEAEAGETVQLAPGDTLVLSLPANPGTGYTWEIQPPLDAEVLKPEGEPRSVQQDSGKTGAPVSLVFRFTAGKTGEATLKLIYHRVWETNTPPANTYEVTVKVQ